MTSGNLKKLEIQEVKWRKLLQGGELRFVGEIALKKDEFEECCFLLGRVIEHSPRMGKGYRDAILVLAVNSAYFDYDDDGFWPHFLAKLGLPPSGNWKDSLGRIIEDQLFALGFARHRRQGPWGKVGLVLEQCGVTKKYLQAFVTFLSGLEEQRGWEGIATLPFSYFSELVPGFGLPSYFGKFLQDPGGYEFTRDVARNIYQFQKGLVSLEELEKIEGYHPSFWGDLFSTMARAFETKKRSPSIPVPRVGFDEIIGLVTIFFDDTHVQLGDYKLDGKIVSHPFYRLESIEQFRNKYEVCVDDGNGKVHRRTLHGWVPGVQEVGLFHPTKGYVGWQGQLCPGEYIALAPFETEIPQELIVADLGYASLPLPLPVYKAYLLSLAADSKLPENFPGISRKQVPFLSWGKPDHLLEGACGLQDVFLQRLPPIRVKGASLFRKGAYALVIDSGNGPQRIDVTGEGDEAIVHLDCTAPAMGEVWVEKIGRSFIGEEGGNDRLSFTIVPWVEIAWPRHLLSIQERPRLEVSKVRGGELSFQGGELFTEGEDTFWLLPAGSTLVEGTLRVGKFLVRLSYQLHRASLATDGNPLIRGLEPGDLEQRFPLVARGMPGEECSLAISDGATTCSLGSPGWFDGSGRLSLTSDHVRDALMETGLLAGEFQVLDCQRPVPTGSYFLDTPRLVRAILGGESGRLENLCLEPDVARAIAQLVEIVNGGQGNYLFDYCQALPSGLERFSRELYLCAANFDELQVENLPSMDLISEEDLSPCVLEGLKWYQYARSMLEGEGSSRSQGHLDDLCRRQDGIDWKPRLERWRKAFEELAKKVRALHDMGPAIDEWSVEVRGPRQQVFKSTIALMPGGGRLTVGWQLYFHRRNFKKAYNQARGILFSNGDSSTPIYELALLLHNLCLSKGNPNSEQLALTPDWGRVSRRFSGIIHRCSPRPCPMPVEPGSGIGPHRIPLLEEDLELFTDV